MSIRKTNKFISMFFVIISCFGMLLSFAPVNEDVKADSNPATWILCSTSDGRSLYNAATTDIVPYTLRSKSNNTDTNSIDSFLNMILETAGFNFDKVNKAILGRSVTDLGASSQVSDSSNSKKSVKTTKTQPEKEVKSPDKTAKLVNPFDRFGVAGLNWSSYSGEWKYYDVDGCSSGDTVGSTNFGQYYKGRKEPKSTYDVVDNSADPRSQQFSRGTFAAWTQAFNDLVTNFLFNISKAIVTFTIALISFAFVDVSSVIGLNSVSGGFLSIFKNLYTGVFEPLLIFMMLLTAIYLIYMGLIKRQLRQAFINGFGMSLFCIFFAAVIAGAPSTWIPLPNEVATYGEALVINALGTKEKGDQGQLCKTNVASMSKPKISTKFDKSQQKQLKEVGIDMRSVIGCKMWSQFLLRPWVQGQFGTTYSKLNADKIHNHNTKWVGQPVVPIGHNKTIKNWALFQISLQTNAHSQLGDKGKFEDDSKKNEMTDVDGVSTDWYRIVDALSNYDESKNTKDTATATGNVTNNIKQGSDNQITSLQPSPYWQAWIGNRATDRYGVAFLSILFTIIGAIGPLIFAFIAAVYSVGVTLLMAVSPIFLLFGTWAGAGNQLFRGWFTNLLQLIVKKIVAAALVMISFTVSMTGMDLVDKIGWIQSCILLVVITLVMIKSRNKIFNIFANFNFGTSFSPIRRATRLFQSVASKVDDTALSTAAIAYGAHKGHKLGLTRAEGAKASAAAQGKLLLRRSTFGRSAIYQAEQQGSQPMNRLTCSKCGRTINPGEMAYRDNNGNYYCINCGDEMSVKNNLYLFKIPKGNKPMNHKSLRKRMKELKKQKLTQNLNPKNPEDKKLVTEPTNIKYNRVHGTSNHSWMSYSNLQQNMNVHKLPNGTYDWDEAGVTRLIKKNIANLEKDIAEYDKAYAKIGNQAQTPSIPEPLTSYLDPVVLNEAWRNGRYDVVRASYKKAWKNWYETNAKELGNYNPTKAAIFNRTIEDDNPMPDDDSDNNDGSNDNPEDNGETTPNNGNGNNSTQQPSSTNSTTSNQANDTQPEQNDSIFNSKPTSADGTNPSDNLRNNIQQNLDKNKSNNPAMKKQSSLINKDVKLNNVVNKINKNKGHLNPSSNVTSNSRSVSRKHLDGKGLSRKLPNNPRNASNKWNKDKK